MAEIQNYDYIMNELQQILFETVMAEKICPHNINGNSIFSECCAGI